MATPSFYPYRGFISYSHRDKAWCDWLHRALERYSLDSELVGRLTAAGPVPSRLAPVFRDRADFASGSLEAQTVEALKNSQFLIVVASPASAASAYVNEEIRLFKSFGGEERILALIVEGAPPDCFSPALRFRLDAEGRVGDAVADVVAADALKDGKREALVKIVAGLIGLPYDILWQRDVKAERRRLAYRFGVVALAAIAVFAAAGVVWVHHDVVVSNQAVEAEGQRRQDELKRLVIDAAGGGASAVNAVAGIRELLRPGSPGIDAIPAEQLPKLVQGILNDLRKPAANPEDFAGAVARALKQAQNESASLRFQDAAKTLDAALAKTEVEDQTRSKSRAALLAERGRVSRLQLQYREAARYYEKAAQVVAFDPVAEWRYGMEGAGALYSQGYEFGDNTALKEAIAAFQAGLRLAPREQVPLDWASTQNALGIALAALGERESGTENLQKAVAAYGEALKEKTHDRVPLDWAAIQNNLGTAFSALGKREAGTETLQKAVAAYSAALKEFDRKLDPLSWATAESNLGVAFAALGERESGTDTLQKAAGAFREALKERPRDQVPLDWAATQNNLGNIFLLLGERERGTEALQKAVTAYDEALKELKRERFPLDWAMTQDNLGRALRALGEREIGTETLQKAAATFREALKERRRERVPIDWAATQNNLGNALQRLGERESGSESLQQAVAAYEDALRETPRDKFPLQWASEQNNLGTVQDDLGEKERGTDALLKAVKAFDAALEERSRDRVPLAWAATEANLGHALEVIGSRESGSAVLLRAVAALNEALTQYTRDNDPLAWAKTQVDLGITSSLVAARGNDVRGVAAALAGVRSAAEVFQRSGLTLQAQQANEVVGAIEAALGEMKAKAGDFDEAKVVFEDLMRLAQSTKDQNVLRSAVNGLGGLAYDAILGKDFTLALAASDLAIGAHTNQLWLLTNKAHALMFLYRTDEARAIYLAHRNEMATEKQTWESGVLDDFAQFRKAGLSDPLMDDITAALTSNIGK